MRVGSFAAFCCLLACACASTGGATYDPGPAEPIIEHVAHQEVLTPLPIRVSLPASYGAEHVLVLVRTWGSRDWDVIELARHGQTWRGEVSCRQVSTVTGDTRYFFLVLDEFGEVIADSGSPEWPHIATVVGKLHGGARGLAGEPPPMRCHDPADCPPDFPGCPLYQFVRTKCSNDGDCEGGFCDWDGYCEVPREPESEWDVFEDRELLARALRRVKRRFKTGKRPTASQARN